MVGRMDGQYNTIQIKFLRLRNFGAVQKESLTSGHRVGGASRADGQTGGRTDGRMDEL